MYLLTSAFENHRLIKAKTQSGLCGHFDLFALGQHLGRAAASCARDSTNQSALPAAGNGTEQRTQGSAAAYHFSGPLILPDPLLVRLIDVGRAHLIWVAANIDRLKAEGQIGTARRPSRRGFLNRQFSGGTLRN